MKIPGSISISRPSSFDETYIEIRVRDDLSHTQFVTMKVSLKHMMEAITGLGERPGSIELQGLDVLGKRLETKNERIDITEWYDGKDQGDFGAFLVKAVKPFEVRGWKADIDKTCNHHRVHRYYGKITYNLIFRRWVEATDKEVQRLYDEQKDR